MKIFTVGLITLLSASVSLAAPPGISPLQIEGDYKGSGLSVRTIVLDLESKQIAVSSGVISGACSGGISGVGTLVSNVLRFKPYKPFEGSENCTMTITFGSKGKTATVEENECSAYHGAACGWEGQSVRKIRLP